MIYGYARVSTRTQAVKGNSLEDQRQRLLAAGCEMIFMDSFTGKTMNRPELTKLLGLLKEGDTFVVTKLDRFARSAVEGAATVKMLHERGVTINVLNMGIVDDSAIGQLVMTMLLAIAEFERATIIERMQSGKAVAKETKPDWKDGRHRSEIENMEQYMHRVNSGETTVTAVCKELGISRSTWYDRVKEAS